MRPTSGLCVLAVLLAALAHSAPRVAAKPSLTMPAAEKEEEEVAVDEPMQTVAKLPAIEPPMVETEEEQEEEEEESSSKATISLLFSKGSWFKSFFRPKPTGADQKKDAEDNDEDGETNPNATLPLKMSTVDDGVGGDDGAAADDENQRGRRRVDAHLPPHWKALASAPNKGRQPLATTPNKGPSAGSWSAPPPNRRPVSTKSRPPVDGLTTEYNASPRPARKTYFPRRQWYRRYQRPSYYSARQWYMPMKYAASRKSSYATSTAFPNRVGVPNRGNYPNSAWQYSPYNYISKEPPRKESSNKKGDGY